jgi:hypothetical protein
VQVAIGTEALEIEFTSPLICSSRSCLSQLLFKMALFDTNYWW